MRNFPNTDEERLEALVRTCNYCFKIIILKNFAKFTEKDLHRSFLLTYNLQLFSKRSSGKDFFSVNFENYLRTSFLRSISWKLLLKGELYEKWRTDILIIKRYREVHNSFKEQMLQGKVNVCENHFIKGIVLTYILYLHIKYILYLKSCKIREIFF